jgi:DNA-binding NtrC family response regulator
LRERPGDVAALAEHFARRYADVNALPYRPLTRAALQRLAAHGWRGNVRELENTLHRAVLLAHGDSIDLDAIELAPGSPAAAPAAAPPGIAGLVGRRMEEVERDLIVETLTHTLGNRTHAATILGISIRALRNKLRDYSAQGVAVPPPAAGVAA